jgi:phospholipase C
LWRAALRSSEGASTRPFAREANAGRGLPWSQDDHKKGDQVRNRRFMAMAPTVLALVLVSAVLAGSDAAAKKALRQTASGPLQCQADGKVKFKPPLSASAPTSTVLSIKAKLTCSTGTTGTTAVTVTSGTLKATSTSFVASCTSTELGAGSGILKWRATGGRVDPTTITWSTGSASGSSNIVLDVPGTGTATAAGSYGGEGPVIHIVSEPLAGGRCSRSAAKGFSFAAAGGSYLSVTGLNLIKHVIVITQENRSFDHYFGTFPGADGFPAGVCVPDPVSGTCVAPFHDTSDMVYGGPHGAANATADINGGKMDGFIAQAEKVSSPEPLDVLSYKDQREIPNYWAYAQNFVLEDHLYEPNASWSLPSHLYSVSDWSAICSSTTDPSTCKSTKSPAQNTQYPWTDLTYVLHKNNVSWGYYVMNGSEPDCVDDSALTCVPGSQDSTTPSIWNPLPSFETVIADGQTANVQSVQNFYTEAQNGTLPAVSWIDPSGEVSEHPTSLISAGQTYVTGLINAVASGPDWNSTAIFLNWDDWGGFYDQVDPPNVDANGFGLRVPGIIISPYAKSGIVDHQSASFDGINRFIEDAFLKGQRIDPATDGRPDPRPDVRENLTASGDLTVDFDFTQSPRPPLILPIHPTTDLTNSG